MTHLFQKLVYSLAVDLFHSASTGVHFAFFCLTMTLKVINSRIMVNGDDLVMGTGCKMGSKIKVFICVHLKVNFFLNYLSTIKVSELYH